MWIFAIGFLAQAFFSARILLQWALSERAGRVLSPGAFWVLSLAGSYLFFVYGWLRDDFAIILGQFISYYIYIWNLREKTIWFHIPRPCRWVLGLTPFAAFVWLARDLPAFAATFLHNADVPLSLLLLGTAGQAVFTLRFVYQWLYSRRRGDSLLPAGFWMLSLAGSSMIVLYACLRHDPVLIVGQSFGLAAYLRNLMLSFRKTSQTQ